ncbi:hypothetical protein GCM10010305_46240 [Streptomyces termitum]|uniref:Uncharacterized protein n=1 Tax=Streptomyces termitum TaxID=67368 RepID=A0A918T578_9ACTN|nr:hypothetical protein GCM10010305_46240 [Streptomyces termitum]
MGGLAVRVVDAEHLGVARVVRRRGVLLRVSVRIAEVLRLPVRVPLPLPAVRLSAVGLPAVGLSPVRLLLRLLPLLLGLLLRVARRGRVVPVRRLRCLLRSMLSRGVVVPAASVPESSHVIERTRFRSPPAPLRLTCDIP